MGTFSWLGGDIGNAFHWVSGGSAGTEPGPTDVAGMSIGGLVVGAANVGQAELTGAFVFSGATLMAGGETLSAGGSIVQKDGINAIVSAGHSLVLNGASYTLSGGTLSAPQAAEFLSGTFKQFSGANTAGGISIAGTYSTTPSAARSTQPIWKSPALAPRAARSRIPPATFRSFPPCSICRPGCR
jgi:hypothetical protein